jgi:hypothetical protein
MIPTHNLHVTPADRLWCRTYNLHFQWTPKVFVICLPFGETPTIFIGQNISEFPLKFSVFIHEKDLIRVALVL